MILLSVFIFIPGVYVLANLPNLGIFIRALASVAYVVIAEVVAIAVLIGVDTYLRDVL